MLSQLCTFDAIICFLEPYVALTLRLAWQRADTRQHLSLLERDDRVVFVKVTGPRLVNRTL